MAKRRMGIIVLVLVFCLGLMPCAVQAVSTSDAKEPISPDAECTLTLCYGYEDQVFPGQTLGLYRIAEVSADFQYTLTPSFAASGLTLSGVQTNGEWNVIRSTLEAYILANGIQAHQTATTDEQGQACFRGLKPGLYLVSDATMVQEELTCYFASALVALPGLDEQGLWQYQVTVAAKPKVLPPIQPDEELELKVLKLWKGDTGSDRPKTVEVQIFRDGVIYETVTLSQENHWSYHWTTKADGAIWHVVEKNVPEGYTMTVEQRDTAFVITNTRPNQPKTMSARSAP